MMNQKTYNRWRMANVTTVGYCTFCVVLVGFVMLLSGAIICGIAYTEVRPNIADENYERYIRSDLKRVIGPIMLSFGLLCIISGCVFFGCNLFSASIEHRRMNKRAKQMNKPVQGYMPPSPDPDKEVLSDV